MIYSPGTEIWLVDSLGEHSSNTHAYVIEQDTNWLKILKYNYIIKGYIHSKISILDYNIGYKNGYNNHRVFADKEKAESYLKWSLEQPFSFGIEGLFV